MATPLETYQEWERTGSKTTAHVFKIERGDQSAANRLTLTDKPYYDKGVSGSKYHDTYPAPKQAIISEIITDEQMGGTTIADLILVNGSGTFNTILSGQNIIGQEVIALRGDQGWSLMETDYPERFTEMIRGRVKEVLPGPRMGTIRVRLDPYAYDLDIRIGREGFPKGYGMCFNVPFTLIDSATHRYKCTSFALRDGTADFTLWDGAVELNHPDVASPDYSFVDEEGDGLFYGQVQLNAAPAGKLTAYLNQDYANEAFRNARWIINFEAMEDYYLIQESIDASAIGNVWDMLPGEERFYIVDADGANGTLREFSLSPAGDLSSWSSTADSYNLYDDVDEITGLHVIEDETRLYAVGSLSGVNYLFLFTFGTAGVPSTLTLTDSFSLAAISSGPCDVWVSADESVILIMHFDETIYQYSQSTPGSDLNSVTSDNVSKRFNIYDRSAWCFDVADDGKRLYIAGGSNAHIFQFTLPTANDIEEIVFDNRAYNHSNSVTYIDPFFIHVSSSSFFVFNGSFFINRSDFVDGNYTLPRLNFFSNVYDAQSEVEAGVHYASLTPIGAAIKGLCDTVACSFTVDRLGIIRATQLKPPESITESMEPIYDIYFGDFVGEAGSHIRATGTQLPARVVGMHYKRNFAPMNESELLGTPTEDEIADFTRPYGLYTTTNTLQDGIDSEDVFIDAYAALNDSGSQGVADVLRAVRDQARYTYEITLTLKCISLLSAFNVGSIIRAGNDWRHPEFPEGTQAQVIGRRINWTKNIQTLTIFK